MLWTSFLLTKEQQRFGVNHQFFTEASDTLKAANRHFLKITRHLHLPKLKNELLNEQLSHHIQLRRIPPMLERNKDLHIHTMTSFMHELLSLQNCKQFLYLSPPLFPFLLFLCSLLKTHLLWAPLSTNVRATV